MTASSTSIRSTTEKSNKESDPWTAGSKHFGSYWSCCKHVLFFPNCIQLAQGLVDCDQIIRPNESLTIQALHHYAGPVFAPQHLIDINLDILSFILRTVLLPVALLGGFLSFISGELLVVSNGL